MRSEQTRGLAPGTRLRCVKPASQGYAYMRGMKPLIVGKVYTLLAAKNTLVVVEELTNFAAPYMTKRVQEEYAYGYDCFEILRDDWDE